MIDVHTVELRETGMSFHTFLIKSLQESSNYPQGIIFSQTYEKTYHLLSTFRESLKVQRVFVLRAFAPLETPELLNTDSRIYVDNPYGYDPYAYTFKFGEWVKQTLWNRLDKQKSFQVVFCNGLTKPKEEVQITFRGNSKLLKRIL